MYVFLFLLPIFFAQMEVEACIHLKCAESVVQREIVPMIIIVFSNKGGTDKILSVIVQSPNQKIPDRKTKCVIKTHINIKQNVIFSAKLKPV